MSNSDLDILKKIIITSHRLGLGYSLVGKDGHRSRINIESLTSRFTVDFETDCNDWLINIFAVDEDQLLPELSIELNREEVVAFMTIWLAVRREIAPSWGVVHDTLNKSLTVCETAILQLNNLFSIARKKNLIYQGILLEVVEGVSHQEIVFNYTIFTHPDNDNEFIEQRAEYCMRLGSVLMLFLDSDKFGAIQADFKFNIKQLSVSMPLWDHHYLHHDFSGYQALYDSGEDNGNSIDKYLANCFIEDYEDNEYQTLYGLYIEHKIAIYKHRSFSLPEVAPSHLASLNAIEDRMCALSLCAFVRRSLGVEYKVFLKDDGIEIEKNSLAVQIWFGMDNETISGILDCGKEKLEFFANFDFSLSGRYGKDFRVKLANSYFRFDNFAGGENEYLDKIVSQVFDNIEQDRSNLLELEDKHKKFLETCTYEAWASFG